MLQSNQHVRAWNEFEQLNTIKLEKTVQSNFEHATSKVFVIENNRNPFRKVIEFVFSF